MAMKFGINENRSPRFLVCEEEPGCWSWLVTLAFCDRRGLGRDIPPFLSNTHVHLQSIHWPALEPLSVFTNPPMSLNLVLKVLIPIGHVVDVSPPIHVFLSPK